MKVRVKAWHLPPRLLTGVYFLNSGLSKAGADEATAAQLPGCASGPSPFLRKRDELVSHVDERHPGLPARARRTVELRFFRLRGFSRTLLVRRSLRCD